MNLYGYLIGKFNNEMRAAKEAKEAYDRFQVTFEGWIPVFEKDCNPFVFVFVDRGYQAFTFKPDQVVNANDELAIVTGWDKTASGWKVRAKTAKGEYHWQAEQLKPAAIPEGLVEILRDRVHNKVDEAFAAE